jgi:hypothetical protein
MKDNRSKEERQKHEKCKLPFVKNDVVWDANIRILFAWPQQSVRLYCSRLAVLAWVESMTSTQSKKIETRFAFVKNFVHYRWIVGFGSPCGLDGHCWFPLTPEKYPRRSLHEQAYFCLLTARSGAFRWMTGASLFSKIGRPWWKRYFSQNRCYRFERLRERRVKNS